MKVTDVRLHKIEGSKVKALVRVTFDECFVVSNIRLIEGKNGLFISMPSQKGKGQEDKPKYYSIVFPLNNDFRNEIQEAVIKAYNSL